MYAKTKTVLMSSIIFLSFVLLTSCSLIKKDDEKFMDEIIKRQYEIYRSQDNSVLKESTGEPSEEIKAMIECPKSIGPNEVCLIGTAHGNNGSSPNIHFLQGFWATSITPIIENIVGDNVSVKFDYAEAIYYFVEPDHMDYHFPNPGGTHCLGNNENDYANDGDTMIIYGKVFTYEGQEGSFGDHALLIETCSSENYFSLVKDDIPHADNENEIDENIDVLEPLEINPEPIITTEQPLACPEPMMQVGDFVELKDDGLFDVLRSTPDLTMGTDNVIFYIYPGQLFQITGGPVCSQSEILWLVEGPDDMSGWVQEAIGGQPLLDYAPPPKAVEEEPLPNDSKEYDAHQPFPDCPVSYLRIGYEAYVTYGGGPNNLRSSPIVSSTANNIIGKIEEGEWVYIIDGPECSNGYLLWKVEKKNGEDGWTAEVYNDDYWLLSE